MLSAAPPGQVPLTSEYPTPLTASVSAVMRGNKRRDTKPEKAVRSILHRAGHRFRKDLRVQLTNRACRPDIVFPRFKLAVFIDGCYWHACPEHGRIPDNNTEYWEAKFRRNQARDRADTLALELEGWRVLRIWEHIPPEEAAELIAEQLRVLAG